MDDNWIGLCIWQHIEDTQCVFGLEYKCTGCTESGKARERYEGKKYSSDAWSNSYNSGRLQAKKANQWFIIHNTGGRMYEMNGVRHACINLVETNVFVPKLVQKRFNLEVFKPAKLKIRASRAQSIVF